MNIIDAFYASNDHDSLARLIIDLQREPKAECDVLLAVCTTKSAGALMREPFVCWRHLAVLGLLLPRCSVGALQKHLSKHLELLMGIAQKLGYEASERPTTFASSLLWCSLARLLINVYLDVVRVAWTLGMTTSGVAAFVSTQIAFLKLPTAVCTANTQDLSLECGRRLEQIAANACGVLSVLARHSQACSALRSKAAELRQACFSLVVITAHAPHIFSRRLIIDSAAELFVMTTLSLEAKAIRHEVGAEISRMLRLIICVLMNDVVDNPELHATESHTLLTSLFSTAGVPVLNPVMDHYRDKTVFGSTRFPVFLATLLEYICRFSCKGIEAILATVTDGCMMFMGVSGKTHEFPDDVLFGVASYYELSADILARLHTRLATTRTPGTLLRLVPSISKALTYLAQAPFSIMTHLFNGILWHAVRLLSLPDSVNGDVMTHVYGLITVILQKRGLTTTIDSKTYGERYHVLVTLLSAIVRVLDTPITSTTLPLHLAVARTVRAFCRGGHIRVVAAYPQIMLDTGSPLLTDLLKRAFRSAFYVHPHLLNKGDKNKTPSKGELKVAVILLEALTYASCTPINGTLPPSLATTVFLLSKAKDNKALTPEQLERLQACLSALQSVYDPITPRCYAYAPTIDARVALEHGLDQLDPITIGHIATLADGAPLNEPALKRSAPGALIYLPYIPVNANMMAEADSDMNTQPYISNPDHEPITTCSSDTHSRKSPVGYLPPASQEESTHPRYTPLEKPAQPSMDSKTVEPASMDIASLHFGSSDSD
ncbi:hypothetical protein GMRT_14196 [Giardia muris]|uniref:Pre-rRNA-processing protein RIX1 n=1 Tax=Giardia muris TaxID=5742 RepID=A0A4Z1SZU4_GIAMU|nr:hypothetical protein GMRT_14196 [Giardia muris]|eukprot:TNJ30265.1 hypothetical protein GMRT_14196 [Giardia muris]